MSETPEYVLKSDYDKLVKDVKSLQRKMKKLMKAQVPEGEEKPKRVNGFAKPTTISSELCEFLDLEPNTLIARTEVTKLINKYVKSNNLQNQENKRIISMDDKMKKLIEVPEGTDLTFFNLQKYIKHHYLTAEKEQSKTVDVDVCETTEKKEETPKKVVKKRVVKK